MTDSSPISPATENCVVGFSKVRVLVEEFLLLAKEKQNRYYDRTHAPRCFVVGDHVLFKDMPVCPA